MDWKIELVAIPVTDVDRAKAFYVEQAGFHADHDHQVNDALRFVQLTPPGSACSIVLGTGITQIPPGSQKGVQCVVADVTAARQVALDEGYLDKAMALCRPGREIFVVLSSKVDECWSLVVESRIYASMGSEEKAGVALDAAMSLARELGREDNFVDQFLTDTGPDVRDGYLKAHGIVLGRQA